MISYNLYFEAFNLRSLFRSSTAKKLAEEDLKKRKQEALSGARENFIKLKTLLRDQGYSIIKSDDGSWMHRKNMQVGLDKPSNEARFAKIDIPFLKVLFTLAHETGHALQWETGKREKTMEKLDELHSMISDHGTRQVSYQGLPQKQPYWWKHLTELYDFWYEIDAWLKGMKFIPPKYIPLYKQYAKKCYMTYATPLVRRNLSRYILELKMLDFNKY